MLISSHCGWTTTNDTYINRKEERHCNRSFARIGRAVAERLAREGFSVTVNYAGNATRADKVVAEIKSAGGQAIAAQADVASGADVARLFKEALDTFGGIDVVVNCAGIMPLHLLLEATWSFLTR